MPIDLSKFENVDKRDGMAVYQRGVDTPIPENEDGSGYTTEGNIQTAYRAGRYVIKVIKVSNLGWSVWRYKETENGIEMDKSLGSNLNAQEAHRIGQMNARKMAQ